MSLNRARFCRYEVIAHTLTGALAHVSHVIGDSPGVQQRCACDAARTFVSNHNSHEIIPISMP